MLSGVDADTQSALVGFVAEPGSANFDVTAKTQVNARASSAFGIHPYFSTRLLMGLHDYDLDPQLASYQGAGESVVIISSGIDLDHPFFGPDSNLDGVSDRIVYSYDFSGTNDSDASDVYGAGTYAASIIASSDDIYSGIAPDANIIALKVTSEVAVRRPKPTSWRLSTGLSRTLVSTISLALIWISPAQRRSTTTHRSRGMPRLRLQRLQQPM